MTKAELVKQLKEKAGLASQAQAEAALSNVFDIIGVSLRNGESITIQGFGSFKVTERKARKGRNPRTGQEITIPASKVVSFTASKALKDSVK